MLKQTKVIDKLSKLNDSNFKLVSELINSLETIETRIKTGKALSYNHRLNYDDKYKWEPILEKYLLDHKLSCEKNMTDPNYDLLYRSRYSKEISFSKPFIKIYSRNNQAIVMSDYLMYNKNYNIPFNMIDRYLPYCKIKVNNNQDYQLDGWYYNSNGYANDNSPHYKINFDMSDYDTMELLKTEEEKRLAVRAMLQIMNESPLDMINLNNYYVISEWYSVNDSYLNSYNGNLDILNFKKRQNNKEIILDDLTNIKINKLLTKKEIISILYANAIYGNDDQYEMFGTSTDLDKLSHITNLDYIENIGNVKIKVNINTDLLDLTEYCKINGISRTNYVITSINYNINDKVNCSVYKKLDGSEINKYDVLVSLYNNNGPFGMGMIHYSNEPMTLDEAKKILNSSDSNSVDYYKGVGIKMNFNTFPILYVKRFNDRNNNNFDKCIQSIVDGTYLKKDPVTEKHIINNIIKMFTRE
jgi:hypothetical protein